MMGNSKINPKIYSALGQGGSMFGITLPDVARKKDNVIVLSADMCQHLPDLINSNPCIQTSFST